MSLTPRPIKFLLLSDEFPPFNGGIARVCGSITRELRTRGHAVTVFTDGTRCPGIEGNAGDGTVIELHHRPSGKMATRFHRYVTVPKLLKTLVRQGDFDVILVADSSFCPAMPMRGTNGNVPYAMLLYGSELLSYSSRPFARRVLGRAIDGANHLFSITRYVDRILQEKYGVASTIAYCGVEERFVQQPRDPQAIDELRHRYGISPEDFVIGSVCRLDYRKGIDVVMDAVKRIENQFPNLKYFIGGVGDQDAKLREQVKRLHLSDRIIFGGRIAEEELVSHYDLFDVYAMPNRVVEGLSVEGFGIAFVEAAARSVPSIGVDNGGVGEAIDDGVSGRLLDQADADLVAQAIASVCTGADSFSSDALKTHAAKFTWQKCVDDLLAGLTTSLPSLSAES